MNDAVRVQSAQVQCRVCDSTNVREFFRLDDVPTQDGLLWPTHDDAIKSPVGDIALVFCESCGHVFNRSFETSRLIFDPCYDISLFHSPMYAKFCDATAARLVSKHGLRGRTALEIACGKGEFLQCLIRGGMGRAIGFDPTFTGEATTSTTGEITVIKDYYGPGYSNFGGDLVCMRSALQYFTEPKPFLRMVRDAIGGRPESVMYVEVPNAFDIFRDLTIWNIVYEHGAFFSAASLSRLFVLSGFDVHQAEPCFEGQNLGIDASPSRSNEPRCPDYGRHVEAMAHDVERFVSRRNEKIDQWENELAEFRRAGKRIALWGAGARAISFCTTYPVADTIPYVADINPKRQGRFLPRTGQQVVAPEFLVSYKPDVIIATNSTFAPEIRRQADALGLDCDFRVL